MAPLSFYLPVAPLRPVDPVPVVLAELPAVLPVLAVLAVLAVLVVLWPVVSAESQLPVVDASVPGPPAVTEVLLPPVLVAAVVPAEPPVTGTPPWGKLPLVFARLGWTTDPPHPIMIAATAAQMITIASRRILI